MVFDFDSHGSWCDEFHQLIAKIPDPDEGLLNQVMEARVLPIESEARSLLRSANAIFSNYYQYVVGYHACNVRSMVSYCEKGICVSDPSKLKKLAREVFSGFTRLEEVLDDGDSTGFERTSGYVGFLYSGKWAVESRIEYLLGSERLRTIANSLGEDAVSYFHSLYQFPTLIKCRIPLQYIEQHTQDSYYDYVLELVAFLLKRRIYTDQNIPPIEGGYLVQNGIRPDLIEEFIPVKLFN